MPQLRRLSRWCQAIQASYRFVADDEYARQELHPTAAEPTTSRSSSTSVLPARSRAGTAATAESDQIEATLTTALDLAQDCHATYLTSPPRVRRLLNQAFFTKLLIDEALSERWRTAEGLASLRGVSRVRKCLV